MGLQELNADSSFSREDPTSVDEPEPERPPPSRCSLTLVGARRGLRVGTIARVALVALCLGTHGLGMQVGLRAQTFEVTSAAVPSVAADERRENERLVAEAARFFLREQAPNGGLGGRFAVATTSLVGLSLLAAGTPATAGGDEASRVLDRCLAYVLDLARDSGYITEPGAGDGSGSRMHGHCYAVLFLTQAFGGVPPQLEERVSHAIRRGIQVIERSQSRRGGWYYGEHNAQHQDEGSVTVCALQALRTARNTGFSVDVGRIDAALRYLRQSQNPDGGVRYSLSGLDQRVTFALTAAAVSTFNAAGVYESKELRRGLDFLERELRNHSRRPGNAVDARWFYYGNLYAAQAFYQANDRTWRDWYPKVRQQLISRRKGDRWESDYGDAYATAVALLVLQMPLGYLPAFQR